MTLTQLEFEKILSDLAPRVSAGPPKLPRQDKTHLNITAFTLGLAAALKADDLSHALFNLLTSVARAQTMRGYATTPQISIDLGVTFNSIHLHLHKSPNLFHVEHSEFRTPDGTLRKITLTKEAVDLLFSIHRRARRYARHPLTSPTS